MRPKVTPLQKWRKLKRKKKMARIKTSEKILNPKKGGPHGKFTI
jgi:hypothetical protein